MHINLFIYIWSNGLKQQFKKVCLMLTIGCFSWGRSTDLNWPTYRLKLKCIL